MHTHQGFRRASRWLTVLLLALTLVSVGGARASTPVDPRVTTPTEFFGYEIGTDGKITPWQTHELVGQGLRKGIVEYAHELERTSNRVRVFQEGTTEMGRPMILTVITMPNNWAQIDRLKAIQRRLADPRQISSDEEARTLAMQGKAVYWLSAGIHSTERTSPEVLLRLGYDLASGQDDWTRRLLDNVIVVLEGTINPDGLDMVTDAFYAGQPYPGYGKYVNHDDNRDFLGMGLVESQQNVQARFEWLPTVYHDLHEAKDMLYMSPGNDPTNEAVSPITLNEWTGFAGHNIGQLTAKGWLGVFTWDYADMWYPGYNHGYSFMHNTNGRFYELQGSSMSNPRTIGAGTHSTAGILKNWGASRTWWDPAPYPPGYYTPVHTADKQWHLMDAVNLEEDAIKNDLDYALANKDDLLMNFYLKASTNMRKASGEKPYAFVIPQGGGDNADVTDLVNNLHLMQHIEIDRLAAPTKLAERMFAAGDYLVRMNQPFGLTAKNLLGVQTYPPIKTPYDVTGWTYGLMRDVEVVPVADPLPPGLSLVPVTQQVPYAGTLTGGVSAAYVLENLANNNLAVFLPWIWSQKNLTVAQVDTPFTNGGRSFPAGTFIVSSSGSQADYDALKAKVESLGLIAYAGSGPLPGTVALTQPKLGVYARYAGDFSDTSEGWLRIRLDRAGWSYTRLRAGEVATLTPSGFDAILIPSISLSTLKSETSGMGAAGLKQLKGWVEGGGTLILVGASSQLPVDQGWVSGITVAPAKTAGSAPLAAAPAGQVEDEEDIPDFGGRAPETGRPAVAAMSLAMAPVVPSLNCPGSIVRLSVDPATRVGYGYDSAESVWCESTLFFDVAPGSPNVVVARYPNDGNTLLQSGYIAGESWMQGKAAIVDAPLGSGRLIMIAPNIVYRAQTTGTYAFLWNALYEGSR